MANLFVLVEEQPDGGYTLSGCQVTEMPQGIFQIHAATGDTIYFIFDSPTHWFGDPPLTWINGSGGTVTLLRGHATFKVADTGERFGSYKFSLQHDNGQTLPLDPSILNDNPP